MCLVANHLPSSIGCFPVQSGNPALPSFPSSSQFNRLFCFWNAFGWITPDWSMYEFGNESKSGSTAAQNFGFFQRYFHGNATQRLNSDWASRSMRISVSSSCNCKLMSAFCTLQSNSMTIQSDTRILCRPSKCALKSSLKFLRCFAYISKSLSTMLPSFSNLSKSEKYLK